MNNRLERSEQEENEEDDVSAEIRGWVKEYEHRLRLEAGKAGFKEGLKEGIKEGRKEGRKEGVSNLVLRQLRARFGELSAATVARIEVAEAAELELWGERLLAAQTLAEVLDKPS